jgi:hypothetical protein
VLIYFSLLGFAFMTLELVFIQVFSKLVGSPLYAMAAVISVMLVAAALGSLFSARLAGHDGARWGTAFAGLLAAGLMMWFAYPAVTAAMMTAPLALRIAATAALIGPVAFFMGIPFPLGLVELAKHPRGAVAWAWSMNGLFTTIGGVASALLSLGFGFRLTILLALGLYALAAVAFAWLRQTSAAGAVVSAPSLIARATITGS